LPVWQKDTEFHLRPHKLHPAAGYRAPRLRRHGIADPARVTSPFAQKLPQVFSIENDRGAEVR
jgi:hypothetical protein